MKRVAAILVTALLLGAAVGAEWKMQHLSREDPLGRELLYVPTYRGVKILSLGNEGLAADLFYLWAIQYYSMYAPNERFLYLQTMFNLITDLDPLYFDAYSLGGLVMQMASGHNPSSHRQSVIDLYDKGVRHIADDFRLAEIAAWDLHTVWKDDEAATHFLEIAIARPGAPDRIKRVLGRWRDGAHLWSFDESIMYWLEAISDATSEKDQSYARSHLYDSIRDRDQFVMNPILKTYEIVHGECPVDFDVFVSMGILSSVPVDFFGDPYLVEPETCTLFSHRKIRRKK